MASAQVKTAVLLAGLFADGPTTVVERAATRDHTERLLELCGIEVARGDGRVTVSPGALQPFGLRIPGDISSAAFFLCMAAAREGWRVRCPGVGLNPGRDGILEVLRAMGAAVDVAEGEPPAAWSRWATLRCAAGRSAGPASPARWSRGSSTSCR